MCTVYLKLRSVPALVTMTTKSSANEVMLRLVDDGFKARKIDRSTVTVEE